MGAHIQEQKEKTVNCDGIQKDRDQLKPNQNNETLKMERKRKRSELYVDEAVMEEEAKQSRRDILLLGIHLRHFRSHDPLRFRARAPIEIVLETSCRRVFRAAILIGRRGNGGGKIEAPIVSRGRERDEELL